ncbi:unnamed protein product [Amoebophrya sp. A120]|nr:unnamed protein product [Amoebophrya sp. A120]|eukprot:GSA120T00002343001.1
MTDYARAKQAEAEKSQARLELFFQQQQEQEEQLQAAQQVRRGASQEDPNSHQHTTASDAVATNGTSSTASPLLLPVVGGPPPAIGGATASHASSGPPPVLNPIGSVGSFLNPGIGEVVAPRGGPSPSLATGNKAAHQSFSPGSFGPPAGSSRGPHQMIDLVTGNSMFVQSSGPNSGDNSCTSDDHNTSRISSTPSEGYHWMSVAAAAACGSAAPQMMAPPQASKKLLVPGVALPSPYAISPRVLPTVLRQHRGGESPVQGLAHHPEVVPGNQLAPGGEVDERIDPHALPNDEQLAGTGDGAAHDPFVELELAEQHVPPDHTLESGEVALNASRTIDATCSAVPVMLQPTASTGEDVEQFVEHGAEAVRLSEQAYSSTRRGEDDDEIESNQQNTNTPKNLVPQNITSSSNVINHECLLEEGEAEDDQDAPATDGKTTSRNSSKMKPRQNTGSSRSNSKSAEQAASMSTRPKLRRKAPVDMGRRNYHTQGKRRDPWDLTPPQDYFPDCGAGAASLGGSGVDDEAQQHLLPDHPSPIKPRRDDPSLLHNTVATLSPDEQRDRNKSKRDPHSEAGGVWMADDTADSICQGGGSSSSPSRRAAGGRGNGANSAPRRPIQEQPDGLGSTRVDVDSLALGQKKATGEIPLHHYMEHTYLIPRLPVLMQGPDAQAQKAWLKASLRDKRIRSINERNLLTNFQETGQALSLTELRQVNAAKVLEVLDLVASEVTQKGNLSSAQVPSASDADLVQRTNDLRHLVHAVGTDVNKGLRATELVLTFALEVLPPPAEEVAVAEGDSTEVLAPAADGTTCAAPAEEVGVLLEAGNLPASDVADCSSSAAPGFHEQEDVEHELHAAVEKVHVSEVAAPPETYVAALADQAVEKVEIFDEVASSAAALAPSEIKHRVGISPAAQVLCDELSDPANNERLTRPGPVTNRPTILVSTPGGPTGSSAGAWQDGAGTGSIMRIDGYDFDPTTLMMPPKVAHPQDILAYYPDHHVEDFVSGEAHLPAHAALAVGVDDHVIDDSEVPDEHSDDQAEGREAARAEVLTSRGQVLSPRGGANKTSTPPSPLANKFSASQGLFAVHRASKEGNLAQDHGNGAAPSGSSGSPLRNGKVFAEAVQQKYWASTRDWEEALPGFPPECKFRDNGEPRPQARSQVFDQRRELATQEFYRRMLEGRRHHLLQEHCYHVSGNAVTAKHKTEALADDLVDLGGLSPDLGWSSPSKTAAISRVDSLASEKMKQTVMKTSPSARSLGGALMSSPAAEQPAVGGVGTSGGHEKFLHTSSTRPNVTIPERTCSPRTEELAAQLSPVNRRACSPATSLQTRRFFRGEGEVSTRKVVVPDSHLASGSTTSRQARDSAAEAVVEFERAKPDLRTRREKRAPVVRAAGGGAASDPKSKDEGVRRWVTMKAEAVRDVDTEIKSFREEKIKIGRTVRKEKLAPTSTASRSSSKSQLQIDSPADFTPKDRTASARSRASESASKNLVPSLKSNNGNSYNASKEQNLNRRIPDRVRRVFMREEEQTGAGAAPPANTALKPPKMKNTVQFTAGPPRAEVRNEARGRTNFKKIPGAAGAAVDSSSRPMRSSSSSSIGADLSARGGNKNSTIHRQSDALFRSPRGSKSSPRGSSNQQMTSAQDLGLASSGTEVGEMLKQSIALKERISEVTRASQETRLRMRSASPPRSPTSAKNEADKKKVWLTLRQMREQLQKQYDAVPSPEEAVPPSTGPQVRARAEGEIAVSRALLSSASRTSAVSTGTSVRSSASTTTLKASSRQQADRSGAAVTVAGQQEQDRQSKHKTSSRVNTAAKTHTSRAFMFASDAGVGKTGVDINLQEKNAEPQFVVNAHRPQRQIPSFTYRKTSPRTLLQTSLKKNRGTSTSLCDAQDEKAACDDVELFYAESPAGQANDLVERMISPGEKSFRLVYDAEKDSDKKSLAEAEKNKHR